MDDWKTTNTTSLPEKEDFHGHLNMEDVIDTDYTQGKSACEDFETKNLGEYHGL